MKNTYRHSLLQKRKALTSDEVNNLSSRIILNFLKSNKSENIKILGAYKAIHNEPKLDQLFVAAKSKNQIVTFPVTRAMNEIDLVEPNKNNEFTKNKYGICEPLNGKIIGILEHDAIIAPAIGVDSNGYRLGFGGGYYDRLFAHALKREDRPKIYGLIYDFQIFNGEIGEKHDIKFDSVFTENNVINFY